jgi:hypothetical protein
LNQRASSHWQSPRSCVYSREHDGIMDLIFNNTHVTLTIGAHTGL